MTNGNTDTTERVTPHTAFLIDPTAKSIAPVSYDGTLEELYRLLDVSLVDAVYLHTGDAVFVDDEGLLKDPSDFFALPGFYSPL